MLTELDNKTNGLKVQLCCVEKICVTLHYKLCVYNYEELLKLNSTLDIGIDQIILYYYMLNCSFAII